MTLHVEFVQIQYISIWRSKTNKWFEKHLKEPMKSQVTPQNATSNADKHGTRTGTEDQSLIIAWGGDGEGIGGFILGGGTHDFQGNGGRISRR